MVQPEDTKTLPLPLGTPFNRLDVLFLHAKQQYRDAAGRPKVALVALQEALGEAFLVEPQHFAGETGFDHSRQSIRIRAITEVFASAAAFEARLRELAEERIFPWMRIGAVPVGASESMLE